MSFIESVQREVIQRGLFDVSIELRDHRRMVLATSDKDNGRNAVVVCNGKTLTEDDAAWIAQAIVTGFDLTTGE